MCVAQQLKRYYDPEDLCGEEWKLNDEEIAALDLHTYDFSSCFFPKFKIMHFQNRDIKLYTVVLLFLFFLKFLLKLCCR